MPTPISPSAKKILDELRGGVGTPVTPQSRAILDDLQQQAPALPAPAPVQLQGPPPPPPTTSPHGLPLGAHGHVIDPTTGQEMFAGAAQENAPQPLDTRPLEKALETSGRVLNTGMKVISAPFDAMTAFLNTVSDAAMAGERDPNLGPYLGPLAAAGKSLPHAVAEAGRGFVNPHGVKQRFLHPEGYQRPGRPGGIDLPGIPPEFDRNARSVGEFALSTFGSDAAAAKLMGGTLGFVGKLSMRGAQAMGLFDAAIPETAMRVGEFVAGRRLHGSTVNEIRAANQLRQTVKQAYVKGAAVGGQIRREGDQLLKKVEGIYDGYRKRGVDFATTTADGRRVNAADELVTHWIEAGTKGAKYAGRPQVEAEAAKIGLDVNDLRSIAGDVSRVYKKTGHWLEQVGYLKKGTVAHYGDQYAARLYHLASHNPNDIEAAVEAARSMGAIDPRAEDLAMRVMKKTRGGGYAAAKGRKVTNAATADVLGREYQAGVTLGAALPRQARAGARFQALDQIKRNPELFSQTPKPGWVKRAYGVPEGWFHPVADDVIQQAAKVTELTPEQKLLQGWAGKVKAGWASYNPAVQEGNIKQNIALAEGSAAARGIHWNPILDLLPDLKAFKRALQNPGSDPFFEGLAQRSRAFTGESGQLGEVGGSLRNSIGIDTTAERIGKKARYVVESPVKWFGKVEEVFKYSLYKKLVKSGIAEDEAARITDKALFDHTDVDGRVAALNKYGAVPFLSTRLKGLENSLSILLKNPDIILRHSGYRLRQLAGAVAGPEAEVRDAVTPNPTDQLRFPVPGLKDEYGRPRYLTGQLFSQSPFTALNPSLNNPFSGGVFAPLIAAATNYDPYKAETTGEGEIVKPGELPPLDAILQRLKFAYQGTAPSLVGREFARVGRAAAGETRYGGASGEPEGLAQALLGAMTGTRIVTPETPLERTQRGTNNIIRRSENQRYLAEYMGAVLRGDTTPEQFPEHYFPTDPQQIASQFKNAAAKVRNYVTGGEGKPGDFKTKATIRHLADWMMALQARYQKTAGQALDADMLIALSGQGGE